ncbi:hypothetical protein D3C83_151860 [compost metagenome]
MKSRISAWRAGFSSSVTSRRRHSNCTRGRSSGAIRIFVISAAATGFGRRTKSRHDKRFNWMVRNWNFSTCRSGNVIS